MSGKLRKLRIAWSVGWGVLCLLLIVLWVRSYYVADNIASSNGSLGSFWGRVGLDISPRPFGPGVSHSSFRVGEWLAVPDEVEGLGFHANWGQSGTLITVPHWFVIAMAVAGGVLPWLRYRFSLRTLLIATAVIAVVLGAVVFFSKAPTTPPIDHVDLPDF